VTAIYEALEERQTIALERIANALDAIAGMALAQPAPCAHPASEREDRGSTMGHERWRCKLCGYEVST
jgi:hypothetical protein